MSTDAHSARERVLIEAAELADRVARGDVTVLDVRWTLAEPEGRPAYEAGHVPGAVFVDLESALSAAAGAGGRHPLPDVAVFEEAMRQADVRPEVEVVVYDAGSSLAAARLWWLLTDAGHPSVRVLDGGFAAWVEAGLEVESGPGASPSQGTFQARPGGRERVDAAQIEGEPGAYALVDVRAPERYRGEVEPLDPVAGHIPGAVNRPSTALFDERSRVLAAEQVRAAYAGIDRPVLYCGSGITAAQTLLALESAGVAGARIYPGSWSDWVSNPTRPVAVGEEP